MKTFLTILMSLIAIVASIFSFKLFADSDYYSSALLTVAAYLSASVTVYLMSDEKKHALH